MSAVSEHRADIEQAYADVRDDKTQTNWVLLDYVDGKEQIRVAEKGNGGLAEFVSKLKNDQAQFGFIRHVYSNDPLSQRAKFVLVCWCGPETKVMRKAKLTVQMADVKSIFKSYAVEIQTDDLHDLKEEEVVKAVKKAGGANYDRQTSNY